MEAGVHKLPSEQRGLSSLQAAPSSVYCSHSAARALDSSEVAHTVPPFARLRLVSNSRGVALLGELVGLEAVLLGLERVQHVRHQHARRLNLYVATEDELPRYFH